ncbi:uncharacterized protein TNCT_710581 [Trichonephila clavata]|uniref:Uncharacterized protein n=1 Tax=Trichonephila clavata TaxID=2740835 RepID=A0A8X6L496_TRICU|nr:uncharacterized protein TNCT_710581 [Trichonephila clavata]
MLTLKEIILVKFAAGFVNNSDARKLINDFREEVWKKALREKISSLNIPLIFHEEIIAFIKPIKLDVDYWRRDHNGIFTAKQESCVKFCFKVNGMVDRIKTADALIHSEWLDVQSRFVLACQYWSGWDVLTFFKNLYKAERNRMLHKFSKKNKKLSEHEKKIVQWIKHYKGGCISKSLSHGGVVAIIIIVTCLYRVVFWIIYRRRIVNLF